MSSRNDNSEGAGFAMLAGGIVIMGTILFALAAFVAAILTVLCIIAWSKSLTLGKFTIEPHEARAFVGGGLVGFWLLPIFALFCAVLFHVQIADFAWSYLMLGGYVAGAFGTTWFMAEHGQQEQQAPTEIVTLPADDTAPPVIGQTPSPFHFASWDDEDEVK